MNIWNISLSNIRHKKLYVFLGVFSLSISIGLLFGIQQLDNSIQKQFENSLGDIEMVVGAKGSPLQLVLSAVLQMDNPTGNISYLQAQKLGKNPLVKKAVPISYGDNYKGFRIVGAPIDFPSLYKATIGEGREAEKPMEVVLGAKVAQELGLVLGDTFLSSHGLAETAVEEHGEAFTIVGVYGTTYTVLDRLIVTPLTSIWEVHHNEGAHDDEENQSEVTAVLVSFKNPIGLLTVPRSINTNTDMQAALPKYELDRLFNFTGIGVKAVSWIAYIVLIISCITIFISLYKMVKERAFDLALMRTYGASNFQLVRIVAYEGLVMVVLSLVLGFLLSRLGLYFAVELFKSQYQQQIPLSPPVGQMLQTTLLITLVVGFAILLAILPILKMNISKILSDEK